MTQPRREAVRPQEPADLLAAVLDCAGDAVVACDAAGVLTFFNPAARALHGLPAEAIPADRWADRYDLFRPDGVTPMPTDETPLLRALREGQVRDAEVVVAPRGRPPRVLVVSGRATRDAAGRTTGAVVVMHDVTDRRRAEAARLAAARAEGARSAAAAEQRLRESEHRFRRLMADSPLSKQILAADGRTVYVNAAWERLWGIAPAELDGYSLLTDPELERLGVAPLVRRAFAGEPVEIPPIPYVLDRGAFRGQTRWVGAFAYPVTAPDGTVEQVVLAHNDVTDRMVAEARLRDSEAAFRLLFECLPVGTGEADPATGRLLRVNQRLCEITGYPPDELVGMELVRLTHPDDRPGDVERYARLNRGETDRYDFEKRYVRRDGRVIWVRVTVSALRDDAGRPVKYFGSIQDVTDRRLAERALAESEARFRHMADSIPQLAWMAGPDGAIFWFNRRWYEYTGTTEAEMLGWGWQSAHDPSELPRMLPRFRQHVAAAEPWEDTFPLRGGDGQFRWFLSRAMPLRDAAGAVVLWFGTNTDVQDERAARQQAEASRAQAEAARAQADAAREEAERANRLKDEFLTTLSHELRTPLNAILGWAQLLQVAGPAGRDQELTDGLAVIERNARAQTQIIEDLLDMSRIVSGKLRLDVRPTDLRDAVRAAVDTVGPAARAKNIRLTAALDPSAPAVVAGDPGRLQQVFWNLLSNAVKFTPAGGSVGVAVLAGPGRLVAQVTDTGPGIRPEFLPYVFERFRQADATTTRRHGGLGLGLAIVKSLVELHGGTVTVAAGGESGGATFTVTLPTGTAGPPPAADAPRGSGGGAVAARASLDGPDLAGVRVLVVEDDADARALAARVLTGYGATVTTAASAEAGLAALTRPGEPVPDVLLSDIGMPGTDGYELIRQVRRLPGRAGTVPAAAVTAFARGEDRRQALLAGFQAHVTKPLDPSALAATVAALAGRTASPAPGASGSAHARTGLEDGAGAS